MDGVWCTMDDGRWTMDDGETPAAFEPTTRIVSKIPLRSRSAKLRPRRGIPQIVNRMS